MRLYKIRAMLHSDFIVLTNSKWRLIEHLYLPITSLIIWALFSASVKGFAAEAGLIILMVNIFWSFAYISQAAVSQELNEEIWSGSFKQIISTGITEFEYLFARMVLSLAVTTLIAGLMFGITLFFFNVSLIAEKSLLITAFLGATFLASLGMATLVAAAMLTLGREYSFLSWSALQMFILLSAPFYPVSIFPGAVQVIAAAMPYTNVFEGMRTLITSGSVPLHYVTNSWLIAAAYFVLSLPIYRYAFRRARKTGALVRLT
ncbi:MAG: ABC transporter permease [Candidatus Aenigmarchaeota archaeon]|nr:ABC transporter permease [Candidatus Aenigmarchaeota archaeon]